MPDAPVLKIEEWDDNGLVEIREYQPIYGYENMADTTGQITHLQVRHYDPAGNVTSTGVGTPAEEDIYRAWATGDTRSKTEARARAALASNRDYLALASPTNAQNLAQIRALTRQGTALIKLQLGINTPD